MPPTLEQLRERVLPWVEPVPGAAPAGVQAKHEPAYEAITTEVARLESPASGGVRWDEVVQGAGELLKHTTKDLWLTSYMAYGLYATRGLDGAATGAALIAEVTERYWPDLFPELKRLRGRANAVGWFVERLGKMLPLVDPATVSAEPLDALATAVKRLSQLSRERFADAAPAFGPLQDAIARLRAGLPEPAPAAEPTPTDAAPVADAPPTGPEPLAQDARAAPAQPASVQATPAPTPSQPARAAPPPPVRAAPVVQPPPATAPVAPPAPAPVAVPPLPSLPSAPDLSSAEAVTDFLRTVGSALLSAAGALRQASAVDPLPYRLIRQGLWLHLSRPPAAGANGRTPLPPLPDALRTKLETLEAHQRWADLLDEAESALGQHRFALGLHRFSAAALKGLGDSHAPARAALVQELGTQLRRMPGVEELLAANGSPLTDEATRAWLRAEVLTASPAAPASAAPVSLSLPPLPLAPEASASGSGPALEDEARALLAEGRIHEAVTRLQQSVAAATTGRARFLARLALARLCANAGQLPLARAVYDVLDEEVSAHELDTWEPALAAACLEGWLSTRTPGEKEGGRLAAQVRNRYRRLARLDSSAALRVGT
jgi:type VI secretion system protein VasJ